MASARVLILYSTTDNISIRFEGQIDITEDSQAMNMAIQSITSKLNLVTADDDIKTRAEEASGSVTAN